MCILAILTALSLILALCATFRVGNQIKISFKFIPVFIAGALYGPVAAGLAAAAGDIINTFLIPVGPWLPQITAIEFIYGALFGLFFYNAKPNRAYYVRALLCALTTFFISITVMTYILVNVGYLPSFWAGAAIRLPAVLLTAAVHIAVCSALRRVVFSLKEREARAR